MADETEVAAPAVAATVEEKKEEKKEAPAKFKALIESVEKMTVLELHELVKALESHWGVSAAAVAAAAPAAGEAVEEKRALTLISPRQARLRCRLSKQLKTRLVLASRRQRISLMQHRPSSRRG